ncbi:MAG: 2-amino-4-hydroxy-6-hydroxymethyldihydropteridine diphosphokinase [Desulfonatronovibrio sp.]
MGEKVFVSLGSNVGLCNNNLQNAITLLSGQKNLKLITQSSVYQTEPQEYKSQPWFINQIVLLEVMKNWTPWSLLDLLKKIEIRMGRTRGMRKGPRIIDLDILIYGERIIDHNSLRIPHAQMKQRAFVLVPLMEIEPDYVFPCGASLKMVMDKIDFRLEGNKIYQ